MPSARVHPFIPASTYACIPVYLYPCILPSMLVLCLQELLASRPETDEAASEPSNIVTLHPNF